MKVEEEELEAHRRVSYRFKWFALQCMCCVELVLTVWGYHLGYLADVIQPCMLNMTYNYVVVGGVP